MVIKSHIYGIFSFTKWEKLIIQTNYSKKRKRDIEIESINISKSLYNKNQND